MYENWLVMSPENRVRVGEKYLLAQANFHVIGNQCIDLIQPPVTFQDQLPAEGQPMPQLMFGEMASATAPPTSNETGTTDPLPTTANSTGNAEESNNGQSAGNNEKAMEIDNQPEKMVGENADDRQQDDTKSAPPVEEPPASADLNIQSRQSNAKSFCSNH